MQMQMPKWKILFFLKNSISPSSSLDSHYAYFHSTTATLAKWKNKWNNDPGRVQRPTKDPGRVQRPTKDPGRVQRPTKDPGRAQRPTKDPGRAQRPTKTSVRYEIRQRRADAKKALNDFIFSRGCSTLPFKKASSTLETDRASGWDAVEADNSKKKQSRSKKSCHSSQAKKGNRRRKKFCADSDEESDNVFRATFGNRCYMWSFRDWDEPSFQTSSAEFEWRDQSRSNKNRRRIWDSASDIDDDDVDDKSCIVGSYSDRMVLGLPPTGPLKIDVIKSTFRSLALKWHPDKHQGPSQAQAEEKFKQCVNAYKALCNALPSK